MKLSFSPKKGSRGKDDSDGDGGEVLLLRSFKRKRRRSSSSCCWPRTPVGAALLALALLAALAWALALVVYTRRGPELVQVLEEWEMGKEDGGSSSPARCASVPLEYRFDCNPSPNGTESDCLSRGCCWSPPPRSDGGGGDGDGDGGGFHVPLDIPYCFYPVGHRSHSLVNVTARDTGASAYYALRQPSGYPADVDLVRMDVTMVDENTLRIKVAAAKLGLVFFFIRICVLLSRSTTRSMRGTRCRLSS